VQWIVKYRETSKLAKEKMAEDVIMYNRAWADTVIQVEWGAVEHLARSTKMVRRSPLSICCPANFVEQLERHFLNFVAAAHVESDRV